jgi:hypothetical protein
MYFRAAPEAMTQRQIDEIVARSRAVSEASVEKLNSWARELAAAVAGIYTLADLVRVTGAPRRRLQIWSDVGVLKADEQTFRCGPGVHRKFSETDALIARILNPLACRQMSVGGLLAIADAIRLTAQRSPASVRLPLAVVSSGDPKECSVVFSDRDGLGKTMAPALARGDLVYVILAAAWKADTPS